MPQASAEDFFLKPQNFSDFHKFRGAVRATRGIRSLIDGRQIFSEIEREMLKAEEFIALAFWSFQPNLPVQSREARGVAKDWLELLVATAIRGVRVRVFMADFDPLVRFEQHAVAWLGYKRIVSAANKARLDKNQLQAVVARHEAAMPSLVTNLLGLTNLHEVIADALNRLPLKERAARFANAPGVWGMLGWDRRSDTVIVTTKDVSAPLRPASQHQKLVWIDGRVAFVGGINAVDGNLDTPRHQRPTLPWHDTFLRLEGGPLRDIGRNFRGLWNEERLRMESFLRAANATSAVPRGMPAGLTTPLQESDLAPTKPDVRKRSVLGQVHRTISRNDLGNVPAPTRTDVLEGYLKAIALAERFVYIENQYFRSEALADALIARHRKQKALKTLILLPHVAEELIAGRADPISMHGAALQHEVIDRMQKEVGSSLGIFALTNRNGEQVYVHSKLLIIDDRYGNIGSANANPRSFLMDTEMNFAWYDPATVRRLRLRLWREHLGSQRGLRSWKPNQFVTHWTRIAERNARIAPARREGFVMPFENSLSGQRNVLIPDEFAALMGPGDYSVV